MRPEFVAGFVVAEGAFVRSDGGRRHAFTVALGARDGATCDALRDFFRVGHVYRYPPRRPGTDGAAIFTVQARADLVDIVVPFADHFLPNRRKRSQYLDWRATLLAYSPEASGRSAAIASQSSLAASDHKRSRS